MTIEHLTSLYITRIVPIASLAGCSSVDDDDNSVTANPSVGDGVGVCTVGVDSCVTIGGISGSVSTSWLTSDVATFTSGGTANDGQLGHELSNAFTYNLIASNFDILPNEFQAINEAPSPPIRTIVLRLGHNIS